MSRPPAREAAHAKGGHGCRDRPAEVASLGRTARTYHPGVPPRVEYEVSELGQPGAAVRGTRRVVGRSGQGRAGPGGLRRHRAGPQSSNLIRKPTRTGGACACPHRMGTGASPSAARSRYVEVAHRSPAPTTAPSPACPPRPLGPVQRSAGTCLDVTPEHASSVSERSTRNDDKRARATAVPGRSTDSPNSRARPIVTNETARWEASNRGPCRPPERRTPRRAGARFADDPNRSARLDWAHRCQEQPVLRLDIQPALTPAPRHRHALRDQVRCDKHWNPRLTGRSAWSFRRGFSQEH